MEPSDDPGFILALAVDTLPLATGPSPSSLSDPSDNKVVLIAGDETHSGHQRVVSLQPAPRQ